MLSHQEGFIMSAQIISAVAFCHSRGIVHRSVYPTNIWVKSDGISIKLGDFSSAKQIQDTIIHRTKSPFLRARRHRPNNRMRHIFNFDRAPESGNEIQRLTFNADSWTIGVCVSYISAGYHPFWGENQDERLRHYETYQRRPERLDNGLDSLVGQCLIVDPEMRIQNACLMKENAVLKPYIHKLELGIKPIFLAEQFERNDDIEVLRQELQITRNQNQELMTQNQLLQTRLTQPAPADDDEVELEYFW